MKTKVLVLITMFFVVNNLLFAQNYSMEEIGDSVYYYNNGKLTGVRSIDDLFNDRTSFSFTQEDTKESLGIAFRKADEKVFGNKEIKQYDTLEKGDKVWIFDSEDTGYGRVAIVASNYFGRDYFGNKNQCFIRFPGSCCEYRGIMLHSIIKIHNQKELENYLRIEKKYKKTNNNLR